MLQIHKIGIKQAANELSVTKSAPSIKKQQNTQA